MSGKEEEDIVLLLLSNKDFKDWVLDPSGDRDLYWTNWMKSNPDKVEGLNKARALARQLKFKEDFMADEEKEELLRNIIAQRVSDEGARVIALKRQRSIRWLKIAASFLIVLSLGYSYRYWSPVSAPVVALKTISNLKGQRTRVVLPDESVVYLNASSTLSFPEKFSESERSVALTGEAFFEVVKNPAKPFVVRTNNLRTAVLGTTFNVRSFDEDSAIKVSLVTGKVRVTRGQHPLSDGQERVLYPGEQLTYHKADSSFERSSFNVLAVTGWKDGVLVFDNADFAGFIDKLEQWYDVEIIVAGNPSVEWRVNGHFDNESLEEVLIGIQFIYDLDYEISGRRVTLKCK